MTTLPEWANWLARDTGGRLYAYEDGPTKDTFQQCWAFDGKYVKVREIDDTFSHIKWTDEEPTSVKALIKEFSDKAESLRELGEALTRNWEAEHGKPSVAEYNQWQITQAKAHGYDDVPTMEKSKVYHVKTIPENANENDILFENGTIDGKQVIIMNRHNGTTFEPIGSAVADKTERVYIDIDVAKITVDETHSISFEDAMALVENRMVNEDDDITDKCYETPDIINEPNHYKGKHGIETIDVIRNFGNDDMVAGFYWGNAIKYMTRYRNKNGLEDLKKARKNLDWLIEHVEAD